MTTSSWGKLVLLLWKNWIITKRHYFQTFFEIAIPILACALLILIRGLVDADEFPEPTIYNPLEPNHISHLRLNPEIDPPIVYAVAYSPESPLLQGIVARSMGYLDEQLQILPFPNAQAMQAHLQLNNVLAGLEFPDAYAALTQLPLQTILSIRYPSEMRTFEEVGSEFWNNWQTERMFPQFQIAGARSYYRDDGGYPANYYNETFLQLQSAISRSILLERDPNYPLPDVYLSRYPYPPFYRDPLLTGLENLLPLIIVIAFFYSCINTVKYITVEKERQLKETMKIMGLSSWLHWTAWFIKCILLLLISISMITLLLCVQMTDDGLAIFTFSNWFAVWFYIFVYVLATIMFCFMMSTFFSKANTASGIAGLMWFVFVMPYNIAFSNYDTMSLSAKLALCLFHNTGMSFGLMLIMRHEGTTNGLQWSNMFDPVTVDDDLTVGATMMMLLADAAIYLLIALYVEKVFPGQYGVAEPWYFPVTKKFWTNKVDPIPDDTRDIDAEVARNIEPEPVEKHAGIRIKGLRKVFNKTKVAVNSLHLNMYEDQITVLLGHNGAGKTTTMSMLTGVFSPTSGTAMINDYDIRTNIEGARKSLGLCPQHNVLFSEMTVSEHIRFFARLKGVESKQIPGEIDHYVKVLQLEDKRHAQSDTLSGGMKRKLAVGVALCGGSKVVFCDEPTSGMDPTARRALWDLLIQEKQGRTILLSTHFMDEADILGDRIAIMADGELKAAGSSFFLKKKFGVGYRLICVKGDHCDTAQVTSLMRQYIPTINVDTDIGTELSYVLDDSHSAVFQPMLKDLEDRSVTLGVSSYGISLTTLEEVFLRVGSDSHALDKKPVDGDELAIPYEAPSNGSTITLTLDNDPKLLTGRALLMNQLQAMLLKKFVATKRTWKSMLVQIFIPIFFVIMTIIIVRSFPDSMSLPSLLIDFDSYDTTITVLEATAADTSVIQAYQQLFAGAGATRSLLTITEPMVNYILRRYDQNLPQVNNEFMVGASITPTNHTIWFNAQGYHTAPLAVNTFYNAMLRSVCSECSIQVTNHPLPFRPETRFTQLQAGNNMGFQLAFNTGFAFAFVAALYIMFYIKERVTRAKLLQFVSGANVITFWLVSFVWDFMTFLVTVMFYVAVLAAFQEDGWSDGEDIGRLILVMVLFGFAFLPLVYLFSFVFEVPASGFVKMMILNIFTGTIFFMTVFLLLFDGFDVVHVAEGLEWGFMIFPLFALSHSLSNINVAVATQEICQQQCDLIPLCTQQILCQLFPQCCNTDIFTFERTGISRNLMFLFGVGLICILGLMLIEFRVIDRVFKRNAKSQVPNETDDTDSDVRAEKQRVRSMMSAEIATNNLVLRDVTKYYKKFLAVNQLSLAVEHSQCFGLLGVNGAGKTSTFKMMTGDENISSGEAWVTGISLKTNMNEVHRTIGYCPQFDALIDDLTGRETLRIFALLRGIPRGDIPSLSKRLAEELNFMKHIDKQTKAYSGGNKRKLSTALALMGNPAVVYLDEPTTGMDPGARRQLWDVICKERTSGKAIVLTSHSMEECEALCTRLAIMVNGEFKCLGSTQHLKNKFSNGYFLTIKLKKIPDSTESHRMEEVKRYVVQQFSTAELKEEYLESVTYQIPSSELRWSTMFGIMEEAKKALDIEDYAIGQTSLEQVFLFFTKFQRATD